MRCEDTSERLAMARADGSQDAELRGHLSRCAACSALAAREAALDRVLALDTPLMPGPGFDTRMFARLNEARASQEARKRPLLVRLRWALALVPAIAALAFVLVRKEHAKQLALAPELPAEIAASLDPEELELAMDLELAMELEVVEQLDDLEDLELLADVEDDELARIAAQEAP
jgi:hypothetical protein